MHIVLSRRRDQGPQRKSLITLPNNPLDNLTRQYIHNGTGNLRLLAISRDAFSSEERKECKNLAFHLFELVRVFRNEMGHVDPSEYEYALFEQVRATFGWLVMHCFQLF